MLQVETYLDDALQANTRLGENALDVLTALLGLVGDAAFNQVALGVRWNLTRDEDLWACDDGLGLGRSVSVLMLLCYAPILQYVGTGRRTYGPAATRTISTAHPNIMTAPETPAHTYEDKHSP